VNKNNGLAHFIPVSGQLLQTFKRLKQLILPISNGCRLLYIVSAGNAAG